MYLLSQEIIFAQWPLLAGVAGAMIHVFTGPDHLAAVMPFAVEHKKASWKVGISWGLGHLSGMLLIGILIMLFKEIIPFELISSYSETSVGFILMAIGVWAVLRIRRSQKKIHQHPHYHHDTQEFHVHSHKHKEGLNHLHSHQHPIRKGIISSFSVGVVHGFAGIAHFILFLPMLSFTTKLQSLEYIVGFAVGTIFSMTFFAIFVGVVSKKSSNSRGAFSFLYLQYFAAFFAFAIGVYWLF